MLVHLLVDYSFLYYKYKFQLENGYMKRLTTPLEWHGTVIEKDVSQIYYSMREIEKFRRQLEQVGHNVIVSVCFDMPSARKEMIAGDSEASAKYKSNRVKHLSDEDFENIRFVQSLLDKAGYNTYRFDRYEADDIIAHLVNEYKDAFDYNVIYTPDLDLLVHISDKVGVSRYKAKSGYGAVDMKNFSSYIGAELKCNMPYNALTLYKATVGDKSDCIDGIKKFGPKAFDKMVAALTARGVDWSQLGDWRNTEKALQLALDSGIITDDQFKQASESLSLVRPMAFDDGVVAEPVKHSTRELREAAYTPVNMKSLID